MTAGGFEPIKIDRGCKKLIFSQMIFKITIIGTARIIPKKPHNQPHTDKDMMMIMTKISFVK